MDTNIPQTDFRFVSKNSKYLDPKHKELAKRAFHQHSRIERYHGFQSKVYDVTEKRFLFGRKQIINQLPFQQNDNFSVLEVGSGTGYNLKNIADRFPKAHLSGIDASNKMIAIARQKLAKVGNRVTLLNEPYHTATNNLLIKRPNVILFSYNLTTMSTNWEDVILQAKEDMTSIGYIAVVDFHTSHFGWVNNFMSGYNVRMDGQVLSFLQDNFETVHQSIDVAYGGLWRYFSFVGKLID